MNVLVTGACGQLGNELRIASSTSADCYFFTDVAAGPDTLPLDITDRTAVREFVERNDVDVIINCAAWTNVDTCETDPTLAALAEKLNALGPSILAEVMAERDGTLIHISTDYVYGHEQYNTPCTPDMKGTPAGVYGLTKLHGEERIKASGCRYLIMRTSWLYSEYGRNFCKTMLSLTSTRPSLKVVYDQCGTPTYALDLAEALVKIVSDRKYLTHPGIYNYSNEGVTSWFDFACMIARIAGHVDCDIQPCRSSEYPSPVERPAYSVLDKERTRRILGVETPYWVDSLEKCIMNIKQNINEYN
ncbi:MAG: dTDP-4-dehydrorhamnose reductase [Muribaculaceae bacterium]|nr:dTDP-4-dehydrorhamnose reductase [Muribaculaceae bacterium]